MVFVKSALAGAAAVIIAALVIYGLAVGVPRILELIPSREGGMGFYSVGPFQCGRLGSWCCSSFLAASTGTFVGPRAVAKESRKTVSTVAHSAGDETAATPIS